MWKCKKCGGEVVHNKTVEVLKSYRMDKEMKLYDYLGQSELTENFEDFACEDCMKTSYCLEDIANWEENNANIKNRSF